MQQHPPACGRRAGHLCAKHDRQPHALRRRVHADQRLRRACHPPPHHAPNNRQATTGKPVCLAGMLGPVHPLSIPAKSLSHAFRIGYYCNDAPMPMSLGLRALRHIKAPPALHARQKSQSCATSPVDLHADRMFDGHAPAGDTVVLEFMQRGQLAAGDPNAFPVLIIGSVMQVSYIPASPHVCVLLCMMHMTHA